MIFTLRAHQTKAIGEMHNGSVLRGGVGVGKSVTAIGYFFTRELGGEITGLGRPDWASVQRPKDLYIITTAKKRDDGSWFGDLSHYGLGRSADSSLRGISVTVDSWNNITDYEGVKDAFFIFDEQRLVGSGAWVKAFIKIAQANRWILLSATPGDTWMDFIPVFVANGFYKNRTEFIRTHVVYNQFTKFPKVDRYIEVARLVRHRNSILVEMPYERHTKRHTRNVIVDYNIQAYDRVTKDRWNIYEERPLKDVGEMFRVMRKVVNTDPSRLGELMMLMEKHPKLILFYNFNYELDMIRALLTNLNIPFGEWNGQKHEQIPQTDKWVYVVQYTAGSEGWNCIETDAIAFWSLNYSYKVMEQGKGRIDRMNTPFVDLFYYVFRSPASIDDGIMKALIHKENFQEGTFIKAW